MKKLKKISFFYDEFVKKEKKHYYFIFFLFKSYYIEILAFKSQPKQKTILKLETYAMRLCV